MRLDYLAVYPLERLERLEPTRSNDLNGAQRLNDLNQVGFGHLEPLEPMEQLEPARFNVLNEAQRLNDLNQVNSRRLEPLEPLELLEPIGFGSFTSRPAGISVAGIALRQSVVEAYRVAVLHLLAVDANRL